MLSLYLYLAYINVPNVLTYLLRCTCTLIRCTCTYRLYILSLSQLSRTHFPTTVWPRKRSPFIGLDELLSVLFRALGQCQTCLLGLDRIHQIHYKAVGAVSKTVKGKWRTVWINFFFVLGTFDDTYLSSGYLSGCGGDPTWSILDGLSWFLVRIVEVTD